MVKTKGTKRQAMIGKTLHRKTWTPNRRWHQDNLVTNAVICHEWEIDQIVITAYRTCSLTWSCVSRTLQNNQGSHGGYRKTFDCITIKEVMVATVKLSKWWL
jgi:hypothetical protein